MSDKDIKTRSGILLKTSYGSESIGPPGEYPFTRGIYPSMYRFRTWTMRQYSGFGSAQESNKRYKSLLKKGQSGLSIAFDLPTQMGYDSDHIMSKGEVGKVGVAISSIEDMDRLLEDIPLEKISTSMTINSTAGILLAFYVVLARQRNIDLKKISGTIQNDILKEYIARGTYIYPPTPSLRITTDIFEYCRDNIPKWNTISISGYHIREAGSTAAQELAFTLANGMVYVQSAINKGLDVNQLGERLSFFFNVYNNFFEEIAKFRAARRLWAQLMKERFGVTNPNAMRLRFHAQTSGVSLTAQQPENNITRITLQALAAIMGGTQSLHTNSMDEALGLPTEKAASIALRTQQILANESGIKDVADPMGGSYFIEEFTNNIEKLAKDYIDRIEELGGVIKCIHSGWIQKEIQTSAYAFQKDIDSEKEIIVGVNAFQDLEEKRSVDILKVDPQIERDQIQRLQVFKKNRDKQKVKKHLEKIQNAADGETNLIPLFVDAVHEKTTLGEISDALRKVFGQYKENITL